MPVYRSPRSLVSSIAHLPSGSIVDTRIEDIDIELTKYKTESAAITQKTGVNSIEDLQNDPGLQAQHLKTAVTLLPELQARMVILDMHMNVLGALIKGIQNRALDSYFELEQNITKQTKQQMLALVKEPKGNRAVDKLRLFIIWFLSLAPEQDVTRAEWTQFEEALTACGADVSCLPYIRQ